MTTTRAALFALSLASVSCSSSSQPTLAACVSGWFVVPPSDSCRVACMGSTPNPECSHSDCAIWDFRGYLSSNVYIGGLITYSAEAGTMSSSPSSYRGTYSLVEPTKTLTINPPGQQYTISSWGNNGFSANQIPQNRAPDGLATALQHAFDAGSTSWVGATVAK